MSHASFLFRVCVATLALTFWSCEALQPPPAPPPDLPPPSVEPLESPHDEFGQLQIFLTSQTTDGRNLKLRGLLRNPYPETVDGVRLVFRMLTVPGPQATVLDQFQRTIEKKQIIAGAQTALSWDIETMYAGLSGVSGFTLQAFAVKRGGQEMPPPPGWKE